MNKNINTFNLWAKDGRDQKMEKNHTTSVNKMIDIINCETEKLDRPFNFLDLGCGNGWVIRMIAQYSNCNYCLGIDGANNMIQKAKSYNIGDFKVKNIESYNYKLKFDIIFSMETLYYISNLDKLFNRLYKDALNKQGILIMGIDHYKENTPSLDWEEKYNLKINTLSIEEWKEKFLSQGFKNIKIFQYGLKKDWQGTLIIMGEK